MINSPSVCSSKSTVITPDADTRVTYQGKRKKDSPPPPLPNSIKRQLARDVEAAGGIHTFKRGSRAKHPLCDLLNKRPEIYGPKGDGKRKQLANLINNQWSKWGKDKYHDEVIAKFVEMSDSESESESSISLSPEAGSNGTFPTQRAVVAMKPDQVKSSCFSLSSTSTRKGKENVCRKKSARITTKRSKASTAGATIIATMPSFTESNGVQVLFKVYPNQLAALDFTFCPIRIMETNLLVGKDGKHYSGHIYLQKTTVRDMMGRARGVGSNQLAVPPFRYRGFISARNQVTFRCPIKPWDERNDTQLFVNEVTKENDGRNQDISLALFESHNHAVDRHGGLVRGGFQERWKDVVIEMVDDEADFNADKLVENQSADHPFELVPMRVMYPVPLHEVAARMKSGNIPKNFYAYVVWRVADLSKGSRMISGLAAAKDDEEDEIDNLVAGLKLDS